MTTINLNFTPQVLSSRRRNYYLLGLVGFDSPRSLLRLFAGESRNFRLSICHAYWPPSIVLGPTLLGRVPGFTEHIFPLESKPYLNLTATIGLVLFLFLVGLEIDIEVIKRNARSSGIISIGGILLPFGIGMGMAVPIYHEFIDPTHSTFGHFALFVAVAYSYVAFPSQSRRF